MNAAALRSIFLQASRRNLVLYESNTPHRYKAIMVQMKISRNAHFNVDQPSDLVDEVVNIEIGGLQSKQNVTVHAALENLGSKFESYATYQANSEGMVNLVTDESFGGTYTGVESMGLFWSMQKEPGKKATTRFYMKDVTTPVSVTVKTYNGHVTWDDLNDATMPVPIAETVINRRYMAQNVRRLPIKEGRVRGVLFLPEGTGPFPGVIDMFGSAGGLFEYRSSLLASRGIASLALPWFNYADLPKGLQAIDFDYFEESVKWLSAHPQIHRRIGAVSVSKGGELSLLMAAHFEEVKAVVNINSLPYLTMFDLPWRSGILKSVPKNFERVVITDDGIDHLQAFPYEDKDIIKLKPDSDVNLLILVGEDDRQIDPTIHEKFRCLQPKSIQKNIEIIHYNGAGHLIEPPYSPYCFTSYHRIVDINMVWGGAPKPHAVAQEHSWKRILDHFHTHLSPI